MERSNQLIGSSQIMKSLREQVRRYARLSDTVLISGERGTGKELVAHNLHRQSLRRGGEMIVVDCAALSETVFESDLFGHERGSFTGAHKQKIGLLEDAKGGTLFMDEIAHLSPKLQSKLLRFLQTKNIRRVGGRAQLEIDTRIVVASNQDLARMAESGQFLPDLLDRLNVLKVNTPPLREHPEDIPELIEHFLKNFSMESNHSKISPEIQGFLQEFPWPGNVRQLFNVLRRLFSLESSEPITEEDLQNAIYA